LLLLLTLAKWFALFRTVVMTYIWRSWYQL